MPSSQPRSRSPSPYSRRMAVSNHRRDDDQPRSRSPPRQKPAYHSPSPPRRDRPSSRSPRRRHDDRPRKSNGGFRWKEKSRYEDEYERDEGRLERGYREHERERPRPRSSERRNGARRERSHDGDDDVVEKKFGKGRWDVEDKFGRKKDDGAGGRDGDKHPKEPRKEKKPPPVAAPTGEPLIVVNVNDRLGTKASIPCLASDQISMSLPSTQITYSSPKPLPSPHMRWKESRS